MYVYTRNIYIYIYICKIRHTHAIYIYYVHTYLKYIGEVHYAIGP